MDILALIHNQTSDVRGQIADLTAQVARAADERDAAKDHAKRAGAEATEQRALEEELKKSRDASLAMMAETRRLLEELDRKRQETAESLNRCQAEQESLSQALSDAQTRAEQALAELETERENGEKAEAEISKLLEEKERKQTDLHDALLGSLFTFLQEQADRVSSALASEEERQEFLRDYESFQQARQADPHVESLCEQRDELKKFLTAAAVPAVKDTLQASLAAVEDELRELFPSALQSLDATPPSTQTEELLFYLNSDGHVIFLMPVRVSDWEGGKNGETLGGNLRAMRIIWDMIREVRLKEQDGTFAVMRSCPVFKSRFDVQGVAIRNGFTVKYCTEVVSWFKFTRVPSEVEEILVREGLALQAADVLSTHPAHILLRAAAIDPERAFEDVWAQVNPAVADVVPSDYQETQKSRLPAGTYLRAIVTKESPEGIARRPDVRSNSSLSVRVADKLYQQRKWGRTYVSFEALVNMTHMQSHEVEKAVVELQTKRLLDCDLAAQGRYSLNSAKRGEIELLIKRRIKA